MVKIEAAILQLKQNSNNIDEAEGKVVPPRGPNDFGWDPIFQPNGYDQTELFLAVCRVINCLKYDGMPSREWVNCSLGEASCCWKYLAKCKRHFRVQLKRRLNGYSTSSKAVQNHVVLLEIAKRKTSATSTNSKQEMF